MRETVKNLGAVENEYFNLLLNKLEITRNRNNLKQKYYDGDIPLKDLGISIPPSLKHINIPIGWASKAVDCLASRSRFDGFVASNGEKSQEINNLFDTNLKNIYNQALTSQLIHACSFLTISQGKEIGEPPIVISAYSALTAAALWDYRKKRIKAGITVVQSETKEDGQTEITGYNLYTENAIWMIHKESEDTWIAVPVVHRIGRPLMEVLRYAPSLDKPFGKSRITKSIMGIIDSAMRCALRAEVSAEFFTAPQRYILNADDDLFEDTNKWDAYIGNILAISSSEDANVQVGQFPQTNTQPHIEQMRMLAARFSGETSIPISELGVISDSNPTSAEAIRAAQEALIIEAENVNDLNGEALRTLALMGLALHKGVTLQQLDAEDRAISAHFMNPAKPSIQAAADSVCKIASQAEWFPDCEVYWEQSGFDESERRRILKTRDDYKTEQALKAALFSNVVNNETVDKQVTDEQARSA